MDSIKHAVKQIFIIFGAHFGVENIFEALLKLPSEELRNSEISSNG